jgi:hypothetical protein
MDARTPRAPLTRHTHPDTTGTTNPRSSHNVTTPTIRVLRLNVCPPAHPDTHPDPQRHPHQRLPALVPQLHPHPRSTAPGRITPTVFPTLRVPFWRIRVLPVPQCSPRSFTQKNFALHFRRTGPYWGALSGVWERCAKVVMVLAGSSSQTHCCSGVIVRWNCWRSGRLWLIHHW